MPAALLGCGGSRGSGDSETHTGATTPEGLYRSCEADEDCPDGLVCLLEPPPGPVYEVLARTCQVPCDDGHCRFAGCPLCFEDTTPRSVCLQAGCL